MKTLTLELAADMLYTTPETVSAMIRTEGLPATKVGRAYVLVDEDIIDWLRTRYGGKECEYIAGSRAGRGGATSATKDGALGKALERPTGKRRKNGPTDSKRKSGEPNDSGNVLPLRGIPQS